MPLHCSKLTACSVATRHIQMYAPAHMEEGAENHPNSAWLSETPLGVAYPAARSPSVRLCEALPPTAKAQLQHLPQLPAAGTTLAAVTTLIAVMHRHFVVLRLEATCKALSVGLGNRGQTQRVGAAAALELHGAGSAPRAQMGWHIRLKDASPESRYEGTFRAT